MSCKRRDILHLTLGEFLAWAPRVTAALEWAATFLGELHIFDARDISYRTQLMPLAAIHAASQEDVTLRGPDNKLRQWYWCGVLGELYGGTTETRFARDLEQVLTWLAGGPRPATVTEATFHEERLLTLRTRNSAAYKGIYALLMRSGGLDWMESKALRMAVFFKYRVDIHHIFPKSWCVKNGVDDLRRESIVNKTALSRATNIKIGGRSPATYLPMIAKTAKMAPDDLDRILVTHKIESTYLRVADFDAFFAARTEALLELVGNAMGKPAVRTTQTSAEQSDAPGSFDIEPEESEDDIDLTNETESVETA